MATSRREQAMLIARNQRTAELRKRIFAALESGELPMDSIMDPRLPLTDQERQNSWNQMAANQWSGRQANLRGEVVPPSGSVAASPEIFSGTPNQLRMSLGILARSPEWQGADEKSRVTMLQKQFGTEVAQRYANSILDREAIAKEQRQDISSEFDTRRAMERERRQAAARLASTEPEMLHRGLMNRDYIVGPEGLMERNPAYNPNDITKQNVPQYIPAGADLESITARHWGAVRPDRPNPLHPEKLLRIKIAEENPNMSAEDIVKAAQSQLASTMAARENPARAIADVDELAARRRIAAYQGAIPSAAPTPQSSTYSVEATTPSAPIPTGSALAPTAQPRLGQQVRQFGVNAARDIAGILPRVESQFINLGRTVEADPTFGAAQFLHDLLGSKTPMAAPETVTPMTPQQTESYKLLPDWLR